MVGRRSVQTCQQSYWGTGWVEPGGNAGEPPAVATDYFPRRVVASMHRHSLELPPNEDGHRLLAEGAAINGPGPEEEILKGLFHRGKLFPI
jgi:hypothetical protein